MAQTPFWLEIKTEYIDANLDKVIEYLSKESANPQHDSFYEETVSLLRTRIKELLDTLSQRAIWESDETADKAAGIAVLRMLGSYLLVEGPSGKMVRDAFFFFTKTLASVLPGNYMEDLAEVAVRSLVFPPERFGFSWQDIKEVQAEVMAHKFLASVALSAKQAPEAWYQNKGSICIKDGAVNLYTGNKEEVAFARTNASLPLFDDLLKVQSANDRIQQKDEDNLDVMEKFTKDYIREMGKSKPAPVHSLKRYLTGDTVPVRFTGVDTSGNLLVETAEGDHERIEGTVSAKGNSVFFYKISDFARFFRTGDCFDAKLINDAKGYFSLNDWFVAAVCRNVVRTRENILAQLKDVKKGKMTWWTEDGYPAYSDLEEKPDGTPYAIGEYAIIYITSCSDNGYVHSSVIEPSAETFDEDSSRDYCVGECIYPEDHVFSSAPVQTSLSEPLAKGLARMLFDWQRTVMQATERFRILCVCRILAAMTGDASAGEYLELSCTYLKNLVSFASGQMDKIKPLQPGEALNALQPVSLRKEIVRLLQAYGVDADSDYLSNIIHGSEDPLLVQLAKLVQSCNRIDDVYPAIKTVIKREITRFLAVETEDNTDFEEAAGPNLGVENSRTEFKTSFLFAPGNAYEQNQEKNIFRSLCSFLNTSDGGTLYLGVNDSGGINGLDTDLEALPKKTHNAYKGLDGYIRYITDRAREYFDLDVRINFHIEPAYDNKVVAIRVDPYEHGVVELEGIPYIRNNSESVKMSQTLRRQIEAKRIASGQDKPAKNVVAITEAIKEEKCVILHGYSSGSSGEVKQYTLEPFAFMGNYAYLWAYDVEAQANKVFRISRIGNVQVTNDPWTNKAKHKRGQADIFHFTGDTPIPVKLELDLLARNLLVEEYPESAAELKPIGATAGTPDCFLLQTNVYSMLGLGRFYCGLAGHIRILDAPGLVEYAKEYFTSALKDLK